jgi:hypothetical protein
MQTSKASAVLFADLCQHVRKLPDHKGEVWMTCPNCGKPRKHFSFSERGANCFACGWQPPLSVLAQKLGLPDNRPYIEPKPLSVPGLYRQNTEHFTAIASRCAFRGDVVARWQSYKPLSEKTIRDRNLGVGIVPGTCPHERLVVPLYEQGKVVGIRARALSCQCKKWLSPSGSILPLYNAEALSRGQVVVIVENPVDALLVQERWGYIAIATMGATIWKDGWTPLLKAAQPELALVAFDHDLPGNGAQSANEYRQMVAEWKAKHPNAPRIPDSAGPKRMAAFIQAKIPSQLFKWPEGAKDFGELLA